MKEFLKYTLATVVGLIIVSILGSIIFFSMITAMVSTSESATKLSANSVYQLDLKGVIEERYEENPFAALPVSTPFVSIESVMGLDDILANIKKAKANPNILGIRLNCGYASVGYASAKEIRDALIDFKSSGKFIVSYADSYTQKMYYIASVADKIIINPIGSLSFKGIASQIMFYKNLLDKLGVEMQIVKVGTFKSAVEPTILTHMSEPNREQVTVYINSIWQDLLSSISEARNISVEQLNAYADQAMDFRATEKSLEYGFVDQLAYESEVEDIIKEYVAGDKEISYVKHGAMKNVPSTEKYNKSKVGVIYAVGGIDTDENEGIISTKLVKTIKKVADDESVKAVVFRINSGGGSAYGSEQIWHALMQLKAKKPLIISMGDYAASGGYYIACMGDRILAQPNTLTGSIGVFGQIPNIQELMSKKIGVNVDVVSTNKMAEGITPYRPLTPEERDIIQHNVEETYELFVKRCAEGRNMTTDQIKAIAEGRVWSGVNALENGFVDQLAYESEVEDIIKEYVAGDKEISYVKHGAMKNVPSTEKYNKSKVGVIYAVGGIDTDENEGIISTKLVKTIKKVADDESVKAVVFRINSGGGSAYGSEQIWHALMQLKAKKPLIISMGDYAASGGYYIACMGDRILAQPNTLTGSIGVFGQIPNIQELMSKKIGVNVDVVSTNKMAEGITPYRPLTPEERDIIQHNVEETYELFVKRCAEGRNMTTDQIKAIAEGRVWSGVNALENGLVDQLGGLNDAVLIAAENANLSEYSVVNYPAVEDFFTRFLNSMGDEVYSRILKNKLGENYQILQSLESFEKTNGIYTRLPYDIILN